MADLKQTIEVMKREVTLPTVSQQWTGIKQYATDPEVRECVQKVYEKNAKEFEDPLMIGFSAAISDPAFCDCFKKAGNDVKEVGLTPAVQTGSKFGNLLKLYSENSIIGTVVNHFKK